MNYNDMENNWSTRCINRMQFNLTRKEPFLLSCANNVTLRSFSSKDDVNPSKSSCVTLIGCSIDTSYHHDPSKPTTHLTGTGAKKPNVAALKSICPSEAARLHPPSAGTLISVKFHCDGSPAFPITAPPHRAAHGFASELATRV